MRLHSIEGDRESIGTFFDDGRPHRQSCLVRSWEE